MCSSILNENLPVYYLLQPMASNLQRAPRYKVKTWPRSRHHSHMEMYTTCKLPASGIYTWTAKNEISHKEHPPPFITDIERVPPTHLGPYILMQLCNLSQKCLNKNVFNICTSDSLMRLIPNSLQFEMSGRFLNQAVNYE